MKAAIFNPYLDTLGGGERYTLSFARLLLKMGWEVDIEWKEDNIIFALEKRFGLNLNGLKVVGDVKRGDGYDLCFWVSDGSIPTLRARKNILHFQVPFINVNGKSLMNKMKLFRINNIVCNSEFTKKLIDKEYGVGSTVIYPPVDTVSIKPKRKENVILSVGRFSNLLQSKHQDILVKNFKKIVDKGVSDWKMILVGGVEVGAERFVESLIKMSEGYPIEVLQSPKYSELKDIYGKSKIFWSASGFGIDEVKHPEKVEHFGITTVEAMSSGVAPLVYNAGGHKEIVKNGVDGYLWTKEHELITITKALIKNKNLLRQISLKSIEASKIFSYESFESNFRKIL